MNGINGDIRSGKRGKESTEAHKQAGFTNRQGKGKRRGKAFRARMGE